MTVTQPVLIFFKACLLGFFLGMLYDVFRILRISFRHGKILVFLEDSLYFLLATILSFSFILLQNDGSLRAFVLLGEFLGGVLYFFTLSVLILKAARGVIRFFSILFRLCYRILVKPIVALFRLLGSPFRKIYRYFHRKRKTFFLNLKKHLKLTEKVVYNKVNYREDVANKIPAKQRIR